MSPEVLMKSLVILFTLIAIALPAAAHDPFIEEEDWGDFEQPYSVEDSSISYALYGYLDEDDIDVFQLEFSEADRMLVELLVPVCGEHYAAFYPQFAVIGAAADADPEIDTADLPFELPDGMGIIAIGGSGDPKDSKRPTFVEPFGGTAFYEAPRLDMDAPTDGTHYVVVYLPVSGESEAMTGDYTLATGYREVFSSDAGRMMSAVAAIRSGEWLHRRCDLLPDDPDAVLEHEHE
jgi:hypothetical protein